MRLLLRSAKQAGLHIVGIQEGRWPNPARFQADGFTVVAAQRDSSQGAGCQLWVSNELPLGAPTLRASAIPTEAIHPIHVSPRLLA
eukprot:8358614-Alexandrium_andersonii.AAC.1